MCNGAIGVAKLAEEEEPAAVLETSRGKSEKDDDTTVAKVRLVSYEELPEYMKENEFIRDYYRAEWPLKHAFLSLFRWHNETLNVWTHLIGFLVFLWLTAANLQHMPEVAELLNNFSWSISSAAENASLTQSSLFSEALPMAKLGSNASRAGGAAAASATASTTPTETRWPFFVFMGGAMFCLLSSSLCHLFCCHSRRLNLFLSRFDYVGIAVMIVSSFFPPIYYIFRCDRHWQFLYLGAITAMGVFAVATLFAPHHATGSFRVFRALLFSSMAFSGIVPAVHATVVNWDDPHRPVTLAWEAAMAVSYVTGTLFYVSRVPERWRPGCFDLAGQSHQVFHLFVIGGALAHYQAAIIFLQRRGALGCT
ncbi:hypothetical protein Taro_007418 [Colocasia esculenta]|uniref:Uncharacterized protein n=1 Tax=Colocasia esculenta TaxID=4460 RepID=A0A843TR94_COLES|nr:hypothetical protein [Colocasia esculenta]